MTYWLPWFKKGDLVQLAVPEPPAPFGVVVSVIDRSNVVVYWQSDGKKRECAAINLVKISK